jgi:hypothetical protein
LLVIIHHLQLQEIFVYLKVVICLPLLIAMVMGLEDHNGVVVVLMEAMKLVLMEKF